MKYIKKSFRPKTYFIRTKQNVNEMSFKNKNCVTGTVNKILISDIKREIQRIRFVRFVSYFIVQRRNTCFVLDSFLFFLRVLYNVNY